MQGLFPIGTVVLLKNHTKRILIIGYLPKEIGSNEEFDYSGVPFPEGLVDSKKILLFNNNQIGEICNISKDDPEVVEIVSKVINLKGDK